MTEEDSWFKDIEERFSSEINLHKSSSYIKGKNFQPEVYQETNSTERIATVMT